jgi:copper transporter 1
MQIGDCLTSKMLWNWDTINSCLISRQWHIKTTSQFAASCIAIVILSMSLQLLRRLSREYEVLILKQYKQKLQDMRSSRAEISSQTTPITKRSTSSLSFKVNQITKHQTNLKKFRPHPLQQIFRGVLHVSQFIVAYFIML